ncbi:tRNA 2-thiouridine(34) synthase MnmA [Candidatus Parcubacteria bacterium]|nr:tRNA 2-thiouridine(34) synthase MnmA [Candidatus Parcubacteria bacterium]
MATKGKKVFVGLSGGVDSSVSAALLKEQGYDVTGVFIKVWNPDWLPCDWKEERRDAMRVAAHLNIPFMTLDLVQEYKKGVVDYMISEYKAGRTPNPDVMCNKEVKFGHFLRKAKEMGADFIATGHYARITPSNPPLKLRGGGPEYGEGQGVFLQEGLDKNKDQSYFLWTLTQKELQHVLFPVGHLQKEEVRRLAKKFKLPTAEKKDSQGICFIGKVDMKEFLEHYIESRPGTIVNESGEVIGTHDGAVFYTIGQRHGFRILKKDAADMPYYIVAKDVKKNILTVSQKFQENSLKQTKTIELESVNWISGKPQKNKKYGARMRYRHKKQACTVEGNIVTFSQAEQFSPGQSLVLYDGERCIGGGIISSCLPKKFSLPKPTARKNHLNLKN